MSNIEINNNKEERPFEYYLEQYSKINPKEAATRCNITFNEEKQVFNIRMMSKNYLISFPEFSMIDENGVSVDAFPPRILVIRFLTEGKFVPFSGKTLTYRQAPWGEVYHTVFDGRCIKRLAYGFGYKLALFEKTMQELGAEKLTMGDVAYRFEFINNLYVHFILWGADEEFDPTAQILFEDNIPESFTIEDMAVIGDISISTIKAISATIK